MSGNISGVFSASDDYIELACEPGQFVRHTDFNWANDITNWDMGGHSIYSTGIGLKTNHLTNAPVLKVKVNNDIGEGSVITLEMTAANAVKFKVNGGAFGAPIAVTADGSTWNVITGSGLTAIFSDSCVAADSTEIWVARGLRLLGCELEFSVGVTYTLAAGKMLLEGKYVELPLDSVNVANGDYVYIKVEEAAVDKTTDTNLGHYMYDGNYAAKGLTATQRTYDLQSAAVVPTSTTVPYAKYVIVGKVTNAAGAVFDQMWHNAPDLQQVYRRYIDTTPPAVPTGLVLSTGAENDLITSTPGTIVNRIDALGYLTMSVDIPSEADLDYHEFKIVRLDIAHNPTTDVRNIPVKLNTDDGGVGIPVGISYTEHNLTVGVEYRCICRATDYAGNVSDWCGSADQVIGGPCSIAVGDASPTISLDDTNNFVGFKLNVTVVPANTDGFTVWVGEGAYPVIANNEGLIGSYPANTGFVNIPWKESGQPYVSVVAYDSNRFYHVDGVGALKVSQDNIELAASAQLSTETHNDSVAAHSGTISDVLTSQQPHGSVYKWLNLLSHQSWTPGNVYILGQSGTEYTTLDGCLNAIATDLPARAAIFVMPGSYSGSVFPSVATEISVVGLDRLSCYIGSCDLSGIAELEVVRFANLTTTADISGANVSGYTTQVEFDNCSFNTTAAGNSLNFTTAGGGSHWEFQATNCYIWNSNSVPVAFTGDVDFRLDNCTIKSRTSTDGIYLTTLISTYKLIKDCSIEVTDVTTGLWIDANGAINVHVLGCYYNTAAGLNVTRVFGTNDTSSQITGNFVLQV